MDVRNDVNGSESKQTKQHSESSCCCKNLLTAISRLIEQNTTLIELIESKDQTVLTLIEQNAELIDQLAVEEDDDVEPSAYLDMDE